MMDKLLYMKHTLMNSIENQMCHLDCVDTKELGEAIDMIKDLEEAIYYSTITEAMNSNGYEHPYSYKNGYENETNGEPYYNYSYKHNTWNGGKMYYDGAPYTNGWNGYINGAASTTRATPYGNGTNDLTEHSAEIVRDYREGKSPKSRRMYMEAKEMHQDKATQMRELEAYMQELTSDIVEMVEDASPEEKQYLSKRISTLATKISS